MNIKRCFFLLKNIFAKNLIDLLKSKNMTNQDLANYLNVTRQSVSRFTKGNILPSTFGYKNI